MQILSCLESEPSAPSALARQLSLCLTGVQAAAGQAVLVEEVRRTVSEQGRGGSMTKDGGVHAFTGHVMDVVAGMSR